MTESPPPTQPSDATFDASKITRPDDSLLVYYALVAACTVIGFPFVFIPLWIRFKTLSYRFDDTGVSMCWGFFFRREVHLTYRRLQDIHVTRNIVERWMGLSKLPLQTASGTAGATMQIEGIRDPEPLRDFLYAQMRGARNDSLDPESVDSDDQVLGVLTEIRAELRRIRNVPEGDDR